MINIPITYRADKKGYFDRECPNKNCLYTFKINMDDWKSIVSTEDLQIHCPLCGHVDKSDKWWTQAQLKATKRVVADFAMSYIQNEFDKSLKDLERSTQGNKYLNITYVSGPRVTFINNPLGQSEEWEQEIQCPKCRTRYCVIGFAYFCPCCGYNVIESVFDESLDTVVKMINSLHEMERLLEVKYGKDKAISMCRSMLEGSLGDVISAFQKYAESKYSSKSNKCCRTNDFQIIDKGSKLFESEFNKGYDAWLSSEELRVMNLMFQQRHLYEHNGGIVNNIYIRKSGDNSYKEGQRLVAQDNAIIHFVDIIRKLSDGLKGP